MSDKSKSQNEMNAKKSGGKQQQNERKSPPLTPPTQKNSSSFISDFKLTLVTNTVLICIIAYLTNKSLFKQDAYRDCADYFAKGSRQDGIYAIQPGLNDDPSKASKHGQFWSQLFSKLFGNDNRDDEIVNVYCDMSAGGQTLLMRKYFNSDTDFQVGIESYKRGFGDLNNDFFIGLETITKLTRHRPRELTVVLNQTHVRYAYFQVFNEFHHYKLVIDGELDRLADDATLLKLNNTFFSTLDLDFDMAANSNCSSGWHAGWWFTDCFDHTACLTCSYMHSNTGLHRIDYTAMLIK